jgi:hypothetical protein
MKLLIGSDLPSGGANSVLIKRICQPKAIPDQSHFQRRIRHRIGDPLEVDDTRLDGEHARVAPCPSFGRFKPEGLDVAAWFL